MITSEWPPAYADGALDYFAQLTTETERVGTAVADVLGRQPRSFSDWARANVEELATGVGGA